MSFLRRSLPVIVVYTAACYGQTTQGLISGRLLDSSTGQPIGGANVVFSSGLTNLGGGAPSDASGNYYLPLLSPGFYTLRITAPGYQAQEIQQLELTVAARVELDFRLRPLSDVWEAGQYNSVFLPGSKTIVTFFGPDVDTTKSGSFDAQKGRRAPLESTISEVIGQGELDNLPLEGRDIYAMLVTQPGVTSDAATGRGLGLAVNGTRPTASNFLLDGLENNNYLTSGPLTPIAPEAIQEYRISTNNFSAEYGRTAGFVANAITRAGSDHFHGLAYFYIKNDVLDANGFQQNLAGMPRTPDKEDQPGYSVGGPILRNRLFFSSAYEYLRTRSFQDPAAFAFPTTIFASTYTGANSVARQLLTMYPAPAVTSGFNPVGDLVLRPPVSLNRGLGIERLDYTTPSGRDRILARGIFVNLTRPDFQWNPYPAFITPLIQDTWSAGGSYIHTFRADLTNEVRLGYSDDDLHFNRPHPEVPALAVPAPISSVMNPDQVGLISLPGSLGFYSYQNLSKTTEVLDNLIWTHGRHLITAGAGVLVRNVSGYLTAGASPEYEFASIFGPFSFAADSPYQLRAGLDNAAYPGQAVTPNYNRQYRYNQFFLFAQDTFKLTRRLTLNYGLRYEFFGAPSNVGPVKDLLPRLGSGQTEVAQLAGAYYQPVSSGNQQLFNTDTGNIAVRVGASYDLFGTGTTLLRGAFGTFYDRPFDNLWENLRNNSVILPFISVNQNKAINYLQPVNTILSTVNTTIESPDFPDLTLVAPNLKNGRASSYFAGIQRRFGSSLSVEVNALGTYGRHLLSTDIINRLGTVPDGGDGRATYNLNGVDINYLANQGYSDYNAMTAVVRYRSERGVIQGSYTWSHWIDNQSDPIAGQFFDLNFTSSANSGGSTSGSAAFMREFEPNGDRGNSDYDQRHNLVIFSYWNLPPVLPGTPVAPVFRNWAVAGLAAFRSGFPFTVTGSTNTPANSMGGEPYNPRVDIVEPNNIYLAKPIPVAGGLQLLNPQAFQDNPNGGNEGRNALIGPGLYNIDLSLSRSFGIKYLGEAGRLVLRADAFNVLNHANLNQPYPYLNLTGFGAASFGRQGLQSGFPALTPLNETARQIQLLVRLEF